ncbi:NACHT, LRR and PYD domains-containing protein 4A [Vicugna pacos]|uniref:NACHT, LRR and PYD domains-containing protein 4A n=1 Tax=Vicugna pacos TaxID=30538 RepID=A0ABM5DVP1_VICPA
MFDSVTGLYTLGARISAPSLTSVSSAGLEELPVARCCLSVDDCRDFNRILQTSRKLKQLNVSYNCLDKGVPVLCEALCHPDCALAVLERLTHLDLTSNVLKFEELQLLCKALKQPGCPLQSLWSASLRSALKATPPSQGPGWPGRQQELRKAVQAEKHS